MNGRDVLTAPVLYPATACYLAGVGALVAVSLNWVTLGAGIAGFAAACVLVVLATVHHQLVTIHTLVNSQRDAMAGRIDSLVAALTVAGVTVPVDPEQAKVTQAMRGAKRGT